MAHMQEPSTRHQRLSTIVLCTGSRSRDESSYSGERGQDHVSHDRRPIDANAVAPTPTIPARPRLRGRRLQSTQREVADARPTTSRAGTTAISRAIGFTRPTTADPVLPRSGCIRTLTPKIDTVRTLVQPCAQCN